MAFNTSIPYVKYKTNNNQVQFVFNFKIFKDSDITVKYYDEITKQTRVLVLGTDYSVTITGDSGGFINLANPTSIDDYIVIMRVLDINRFIEYHTSGDLLADVLNEDQEYQTYLIQDLIAQQKEYLEIPIVPGFDGKFPEPGAGEYIKWSNDGKRLITDSGIQGTLKYSKDPGNLAKPGSDEGIYAGPDPRAVLSEDQPVHEGIRINDMVSITEAEYQALHTKIADRLYVVI